MLTALTGAIAFAGAPRKALSREACVDDRPPSPYRRTIETPLGDASRSVAWGAHVEGAAIYDKAFVDALRNERPKALAIGSGLKFGSLHPLSIACEREDGGRFFSTWAEPDDIVALAAQMGAAIRGDALVWNDSLPPWIARLARDRPHNWRTKLQDAYEGHIKMVFEHFEPLKSRQPAQALRWCGIVNEPFEAWGLSEGKFPWRRGAWFDAFETTRGGAPGYIRKAFELSKTYGGNDGPALYLNEAGCESDRFGRTLRPAMLALIRELKDAGCKIDAIGLESHLMPQWMDDPAKPDWRPFSKFLKELEKLGLEVYITELDVNDCSRVETNDRDRLVADYVGSFVSAAMDSPAVAMVTNWDFSDNYSWLRDQSSPESTFSTLARWASCKVEHPACPRPTPYDQNLAPKPARDALARALASRPLR